MSLFRIYVRALKNYPLLTMSSTTGSLMACGDAISQIAMERVDLRVFDKSRAVRYFALGFFALGPMLRFWYKSLDQMFGHTKMAPLKMLLLDQSVGAPVILLTFVTGTATLKGEGVRSIKRRLGEDYLTILANNYKVWPAVQIVNFWFVPVAHRVLFVNGVALGWNVFLAWVTEGNRSLYQGPTPAVNDSQTEMDN